jgi:hypothetical protein
MSDTLKLGISKSGVTSTALNVQNFDGLEGFADQLRNPETGEKDGRYFLRGPATKRNDKNLDQGCLLILDGDSSMDEDGVITDGAPPPPLVHQALVDLQINHVIYTSFSNADGCHKYRVVVPFETDSKKDLKRGVEYLVSNLQEADIPLADVPENYRWSQAWYLPRVPDEEHQKFFQFFEFYGGHDLDIDDAEDRADQALRDAAQRASARRTKSRSRSNSPISLFNQEHGREWMGSHLVEHGYKKMDDRFLAPESSTDKPGVVFLECEEDGRDILYSHHGKHDLLSHGHQPYCDAFDLYRILEHDGDQEAALASLRQEQVFSTKPTAIADIRPPTPVFPTDILPGPVRAFVESVARRTGTPPQATALPLLVSLGGCIGSDLRIFPKRKDIWSERACLWCMIIGNPGTRKSQTLAEGTKVLRVIQKEEVKKWDRAMGQFKKEAAMHKRRKAAWDKDADKKLSDDPLAKVDAMPDEISSPPQEPVVKAVVSDDTTTERLAQDMQDARGMVMVRDELPEWYENLSRYNNGNDRPFYLTCYTGGSRQVRRKGNTPDIHVEDCFLGIVGGAQPDLAKAILDRVGGDDGLADRFGLIGWIDNSEVGDDLDEEPDEVAERDILRIARCLYGTDWSRLLENSELRFSADAVNVFTRWRRKMLARATTATDRNADPNRNTDIAGLLLKAPGLAVRLAGVLHLAEWAESAPSDDDILRALDPENSKNGFGKVKPPKRIPASTIRKVMRLFEEYLEPAWRCAMDEFSRKGPEEAARRIIKHFLENKLETITLREIYRPQWRGLTNAKEALMAIQVLMDEGWLTEKNTDRGVAGRPAMVYAVHPSVIKGWE